MRKPPAFQDPNDVQVMSEKKLEEEKKSVARWGLAQLCASFPAPSARGVSTRK